MEESNVLSTAAADSLDSGKCSICLSPFDEQTLGSLDCQHVFCLHCILQWSQTANTCPVDRLRFAFIQQRRCPGGDILKKIEVKPQRKVVDDDDDDDDDEEEGGSAVICEECGRSGRRRRLLLCTQCDSGYHVDCLNPPLNTGPAGDWICPECVGVPQHPDVFMLEEEISDGELTDLLAEVGGAPSTSSRLRPSTLGRPSGSAGRRRSLRIRSRARGGPDPGPQTSWRVPAAGLEACAQLR